MVKVKNCDNLIVRCNKCGGYDMQMFLLQIASRMMGLLAGVKVRVIRFAPLGDPMQIEIRGYSLALRKLEADNIIVEVV